jgi:uncharacterized damage-inducible protein DinB
VTAAVRRLWDHARWADERILTAFRQSGGEPSDGFREFCHGLGASETWLARLERRVPRLPVWPALSLDGATAAAEALHAGYAGFLDRLTEAGLAGTVTYVNSAGQQFENTVGDILIHAALHAQYHRGKVNLLFRQAGRTPIPADYIAFVRGVPAATTPPR